MRAKKNLESFSQHDLKLIKREILKTGDINQVINRIDRIIYDKQIQKKEAKSSNERFDIELFKRLSIFPPRELQIIIDNDIENLQELLDVDLNTLIGITDSSREYIDWARHFYDMNTQSKPSYTKKKELTNKNNM